MLHTSNENSKNQSNLKQQQQQSPYRLIRTFRIDPPTFYSPYIPLQATPLTIFSSDLSFFFPYRYKYNGNWTDRAQKVSFSGATRVLLSAPENLLSYHNQHCSPPTVPVQLLVLYVPINCLGPFTGSNRLFGS